MINRKYDKHNDDKNKNDKNKNDKNKYKSTILKHPIKHMKWIKKFIR